MMPMTLDPVIVPVGEEVLPGYRVESLLARGGRVDTYDVTSLERDCRAVVKVVRPDRLGDERVREGVLTEGALLTTLAHPHLVRGYELVTAPRPALVLETLPGATLAAVLDDRRLGVADTALLGRQLVSVLGYLHRHGWVHLDVKPDNVVVQEGRAVLIDLGLATRPGRIERGMGTDGYAAPEQDAGGTVSPATDVWGLGATLAECVTGAAPGRSPDLAGVPARAASPARRVPAAGPGGSPRARAGPRAARLPARGAGPLRMAARVAQDSVAATIKRMTTAATQTSSVNPMRIVPTIPQIRPALAMERPPTWPLLASISPTTRLPMTHATGEISWQSTSPRIPRISTVVACGWSGAPKP